MKNIPIDSLAIFGLDHDMANTYIACLNLGKSKANEIAKTANLHRTVIYRHLEALAERGLIHVSVENGVRMFSPANPSILGEVFKKKMQESETLIPALLALYAAASPTKPAFRYYTDSAGVKILLEEIIACHGKFYRHIGSFNQQDFRRVFSEDWMVDWSKRRIANGVDHQSIRPFSWKTIQNQTASIFTGIGKEYLRDYRYAPIPGDLPVLIYLYDEKVAFISARPTHTYAAVLESADVYKTLNGLFEIIWAISEPPINAPTKR
ncbi:MAG: helix-turn-helix domain-containing protein [Patescibacteria group bacterium]|mgnify:CR=1 FL=1